MRTEWEVVRFRVAGLVLAALAALLLILFLPSIVSAQEEPSHWGVTGNLTPSWEFWSTLEQAFTAEEVGLKGSEFELGFVRGKEFSGDWGVSLVRKEISDDSAIDLVDAQVCADFGNQQNCLPHGELYLARGASLLGLEAHKFSPFTTIKDRVQIGINLAVGAAWVRGSVEKHSFRPRRQFGPDGTKLEQVETVEMVSAKEAIIGMGWPLETVVLPTGRVELVVAGIVAPGLKVKFSGGLNFPGVQRFSVGVVYFFGVNRADAPVVAGRDP